ncbi:MAG TPA: hypothetical protein VJL09_03515 [Candidatus Paceibacterota bacterium]|uniref:HTH HARE-type domain-containing protein n=1 Tax=Candidatus Doudnabacteria bacterium RIFCSPHIGHO2_01_52_17 TaxID=1817820 RepID=A0A1F5NG25_9BACT|nr:MAG: hypothetical protein A3K06_00660 [Candidatus Doudnabacteria bacterium RIFCSPHIGHO2_01_52_17]HLD62093.1 hypothetical protein [Patescibacteria group bacterium]
MTEETTFSEAIEKVMLENGYYAPLQLIYKEFEKHRPFSGLTPLKTIQERVQRDRRFTRIGLGVYALTAYLDKLPRVIEPKTQTEKSGQKHSEIQGMIIEIGNMEGFDTYTPDRSKVFANKELGNIATIKDFPIFTYDRIIRSVKFVDVAWFNERGFPEKIFEVEDSTDFRGSLVKFAELQDFNTSFNLVASAERKTKYDREVSKTAFTNIVSKCHFVNYADIEEYYNASLNYHKVSKSVIF